MKNDLKNLVSFIEEMKATSSTNSKKEIIAKHDSPFLRKLFEYVYSPFKQYYVTSANLVKHPELSEDKYDDLFVLLDDLSTRRITGHAAIAAVNGYIEKNIEFADIIYDVIDRNIKTRATTSLINKVLPGTVPTFEVALAQKFRDHVKKVKFDSKLWWASRKLDGLRCIAIFDADGEVRFFSRQGKEFFTLAVLAEDLKQLHLRNKVLDGEICIMKDDGLEDFQGILKEARTDGHTIQNPMYQVFDFLELDEFMNGVGQVTFTARQIMLNALFGMYQLKNAKVLEQIQVENQEHFDQLVKDAETAGYEGIMLRKDVGYEGKRTSNLLKVKQMDDAEYVVIGYEVGPMRIIENGVEIEEVMLRNVRILHLGDPVDVGSGFSLEQRRRFFQNPEEIVGKTVCIQYFEETKDQHGKNSLRFPVLKTIYEGERKE